MAEISSQSAWPDVMLHEDATRQIHVHNPDQLYVISCGVEVDQGLSLGDKELRRENTSSQIQNGIAFQDTVNSVHNNRVIDESYRVIDDTSVLVNQEVTSSRQRGSRASGVTSAIPDPGSGERRSSSENSSGSGRTHFCHDGAHSKMDKTARNQLIAVSILCTLFMIAEIVGGVLSNSLALVTDATHLASDLASFLVSLLAIWLATKPPTHTLNLGYHRAEVLGALVSVLIIWVVTGILVYMAARRVINDDYHIHADEMLIVASVGVGFNIIMGLVLHSGFVKKCHLPTSIGHNHSHGNHTRLDDHHHGNHELPSHHFHAQSNNSANTSQALSINGDIDYNTFSHLNPSTLRNINQGTDAITMETGRDDLATKVMKPKKNINIQAATIHVLGDFIQSIGVLVAAIIIKVKPEYKLADPLCTFLFSVLVLITTVTVLRDVLLVLMEGKPRDMDYPAIYRDLCEMTGVKSVHSLSLWSLTINKTAASVHIAVDSGVDWASTLDGATVLLRQKHGVYTSTIQVELFSTAMEHCTTCQL